ncbi:NUDIX domain-containing protein [Streptomyces sp. NPDC058659]|uniref:NUDIX domain-containing protein n=1 Tax=unclassified Streptomyces TaxID=2593676 RepID=UPI0036489AA1
MVTDAAVRVLLGSSRRGMAELPSGTTDGGESFEAAAVRALAEETRVLARAEDAHAGAMLADDNHGVPRLTAIVRITSWTGRLTNPEPDRFVRWEFHDPARPPLPRQRLHPGCPGAGHGLARDRPRPAFGPRVHARHRPAAGAGRARRSRPAPSRHGGQGDRRRLGPFPCRTAGAAVGSRHRLALNRT